MSIETHFSRIISFFKLWFFNQFSLKTHLIFIMKKLIVLPLVLISFLTYAQTSYSISENVNRIVFFGNSITYAGSYISYLETYYTLKYPDREIEFINVGLPNETVSQLSEPNHAEGKFKRPKLQDRLSKALKKIQPDLIFSCYGMNDGIYLPFDEGRFDKYKKGIYWLDNKVRKKMIPIIHMTPTVYEKNGGGAYANVLDIYSDWLLSLTYTNSSEVIDIHWPLKQKIKDIRKINPYYKFTKDGVHPVKQGHWLIANQLLISLGELDKMYTEDKMCFDAFRNWKEVLVLVEEKQKIQKDAWLTFVGHKRPNMRNGLPIEEAIEEIKEIDFRIEVLLNE